LFNNNDMIGNRIVWQYRGRIAAAPELPGPHTRHRAIEPPVAEFDDLQGKAAVPNDVVGDDLDAVMPRYGST